MAIKPKERYPAQIEVSDPGYPWGKARNVGTAGDGSGTPWTAAVANDIFGFFQALLHAGGNIEPSDEPDKLGASQYLDAILAIIGSGFNVLAGTLYQKAAFLNKNYAWSGTHTIYALIADYSFKLGSSSAIETAMPLAVRTMAPLTSAQALRFNNSMVCYFSIDRLYVKSDGANPMAVRFNVRIPSGCELLDVIVSGKPNADPITVTLHRLTKSILVGNPGSHTELSLTVAATITGSANNVTATLQVPEVINNATSEYWVEVNVGNDATTLAHIHFVELHWVPKFLSAR